MGSPSSREVLVATCSTAGAAALQSAGAGDSREAPGSPVPRERRTCPEQRHSVAFRLSSLQVQHWVQPSGPAVNSPLCSSSTSRSAPGRAPGLRLSSPLESLSSREIFPVVGSKPGISLGLAGLEMPACVREELGGAFVPAAPSCPAHTLERLSQLHRPSGSFDLGDPLGRRMSNEYNSLHDPHLQAYHQRKDNVQWLKRQGLVTSDGNVGLDAMGLIKTVPSQRGSRAQRRVCRGAAPLPPGPAVSGRRSAQPASQRLGDFCPRLSTGGLLAEGVQPVQAVPDHAQAGGRESVHPRAGQQSGVFTDTQRPEGSPSLPPSSRGWSRALSWARGTPQHAGPGALVQPTARHNLLSPCRRSLRDTCPS